MPLINLRNMTINQTGTIVAVKVSGELGRRIREMGLVPGTEITIKQRAPLNDPVDCGSWGVPGPCATTRRIISKWK